MPRRRAATAPQRLAPERSGLWPPNCAAVPRAIGGWQRFLLMPAPPPTAPQGLGAQVQADADEEKGARRSWRGRKVFMHSVACGSRLKMRPAKNAPTAAENPSIPARAATMMPTPTTTSIVPSPARSRPNRGVMGRSTYQAKRREAPPKRVSLKSSSPNTAPRVGRKGKTAALLGGARGQRGQRPAIRSFSPPITTPLARRPRSWTPPSGRACRRAGGAPWGSR